MKYSFILEIDDISKDDINELVNILSDNKIKFHVLKSDKELKENQKYKEVIDKAKKLHNEFASKNSLLIFENNNLIDFMNNLINILKEVEHDS